MEKTKVMVVDDNPKKAKAIEAVFDGMGLEVVKADSGKAALKLLLDSEFAVILLDVKMPGMDGYETVEIIRSLERTANTPIIFITAHAIDETDISKGYSLGVVDYVTSPISHQILRAKVAVFANLYKTKSQLLKIVENNADGILIINKEAIIRFVNPAAVKLFGRPASSLIGETFDYSMGEIGEIEIPREDNEMSFAEMRSVSIEWEGEPAELISLHDITNRKSVAEQLERAKDELETRVDERTFELSTLFDLSTSIGRAVKYEDVYSLVANAMNKVLEYDVVGILHYSENIKEILVARTIPVADSVVKEAGKILVDCFNTAGDTTVDSDEFRLHVMNAFFKERGPSISEGMNSRLSTVLTIGEKPIGAMILASTGENAFNDEQVRVFETIANETGAAIHRLDSLIESEERRTKAIVNSIREGVLFIDGDGNTTLSNPTADSILELYALRQDGENDAIREVVEKALVNPGSHAEVECETSHGDLKRFYHLEATTVQGTDGGISGTAVVIRDISNEYEMERLRGSFLSSISHELRTPLTSVKEYIAIMLDGYGGDLSEGQLDCLQTASRNADRLQALIEDLLTVTRIEAHGFAVAKKDTLFSSISDVCFKSLLPKAERNKITLESDSPCNISIYVDPLRISQVLTNLIDNALKFTPEGGKVKLEARARDDYLLVSVSDNGRGIPKTEIPHIFDLFYKVSTGDEYGAPGGTGLGLFISSEMVKAHGGKIWVESKFGEGTTFFFSLPISSKTAGLRDFLSDAVDYSIEHDLPLSVVTLNFKEETSDGILLNKVKQHIGPDDRIILYGDDLKSMVITMFLEKEHSEQTRRKLTSGVLEELAGSETLSFSKEGRTPRVVLKEVSKHLAPAGRKE